MSCFAILTTALLYGYILGPVSVADFSGGQLQPWRPQTFRGRDHSAYVLVQKDGRRVLQASSRKSASGMVRAVDVDLSQTPLLRWTWKVAGSIPGGNGRSKAGDDYAARVYVIFTHILPWKTRAIAYVWASGVSRGEMFTSPYTANLRMVAVESGDSLAGRWVTEERNVAHDYEILFKEKPPKLTAVGVMTDTDDTGSEALAWYGDSAFHPLQNNNPR